MRLYDLMSMDYEKISILELNKLKNKIVFITGSNGLIGSNILCYLYYLNKTKSLNIKIIAHSFSLPSMWLPKDDCITYLNGDLMELEINFEYDYLIHAATYAQPKKVFENFKQTIYLNTSIYINLLEKSKENGAKVLFLSTSSVYGEIPQDVILANEKFNGNISLSNVSSLYGESKRMAEIISQVFIEKGLDVKIARIAIGYGPGIKLDDKRFIGEFIKKALEKGEILMMDSGEASRQICYITDVVEMLLNVLLSARDNVYNVSGLYYLGYGFKIRDIAEIIAKNIGAKVLLPEVNNGVTGAYSNVAIDISKYTNEFKKASFVSVEHGITQTIKWFKHFYN